MNTDEEPGRPFLGPCSSVVICGYSFFVCSTISAGKSVGSQTNLVWCSIARRWFFRRFHTRRSRVDTVRFGIIGLGNMGTVHAGYIDSLDGAKLTAVADSNPSRVEFVTGKHLSAEGFTDAREMMRSGLIDAVLIATPHYQHLEF